MFEQTPQLKSNVNTLAELLCDRAHGELVDHGYSFFQGDDVQDHWLSYGRLHEAAQLVAKKIHACGFQVQRSATDAGEFPRAIILCSPGPAYLKALFGTMYSGWIAVTAYPPRARRRDGRLDVVAADSGATVALVDELTFQRREQIIKSSPSFARLHWINVDDVTSQSLEPSAIGAEKALWVPPQRLIDDVTILQYTSGSTHDPKGVCLTHRNLLANLEMIHRAFEFEKHNDKWTVTWLPPYHDMGLIGGLLAVMYYGMCSHVMPPNAFVQKPIRWLRAMSNLRAPVSGGPNFAFDMCTDRITDAEMKTLDLSDWTLAFTGAEPIRAASLDRFAARFKSVGFNANAFFPCYGMAEATLMVSGGPRNRPVKTQRPDLTALTNDFETQTMPPALVSCGRICDSQRVRIVGFDSESEAELLNGPLSPEVLPDGQIGEVLISGVNVSSGYWQKPQINSDVFGILLPGESGTFMRTGDLGFVRDGELYISGRAKELIIVRGRNFFPADLEAALSGVDERLIAGCAAAIEVNGGQATFLVIVHEIQRPGNDDDLMRLTQIIRSRMVDEFEIEPSAVVLIPRRSLPKTSSGKVRRLETRRQYENGSLQKQSHFHWTASETSVVDLAKDPAMPGSLARSTTEIFGFKKGHTEIIEWMVSRLSEHLGIERRDVDVRRPFSQYGLDSVTAVVIASELEDFIGSDVPATLFYDSPTIEAVAQSIGDHGDTDRCDTDHDTDGLNAKDSVRSASKVSLTSDHSLDTDSAIAIVGMACRLPGCDDLDAFWDLLKSGRSAIRQPPASRLDCLGKSSVTRLAGWLDDIDQFDAARFNLSPMEAKWIDPQHRLLLETSWQAIENAGIDPPRLAQSNTGVFVGITQADYLRRIIRQGLPLTNYAMTGNSASMAAHRISYHFDIRGPSVSVDTACSSSLVALHQAVRAIQSGDCDSALVGGVNLILSGEAGDALTDAQMLSPDGSCHTFDVSANGYVRGEGCVAVMIKPLRSAIESGDPIHAVIGGTAANQDGLTNGITAPNGDSQIRLYRKALASAKWSPDQISRVETHGTGNAAGRSDRSRGPRTSVRRFALPNRRRQGKRGTPRSGRGTSKFVKSGSGIEAPRIGSPAKLSSIESAYRPVEIRHQNFHSTSIME